MQTALADSSRERKLADLAATEALAARIARVLQPGDAICLEGPLGSGKTAFARAILAERARLAHAAPETVPSPTFTLAQRYAFGDLPVTHFDLYRIANRDEIEELGLDEALAEGAILVEWPERLGPRRPRNRLEVRLRPGSRAEERWVRLLGAGRWEALVEAMLAHG